ncbi:hypothetical protein [Pseudomonas aeruginosa]
MNKANECTCPSGDGSLVHPCPTHPAAEQAGGDERAAFEAWMTWLMDHVYGRLPDFTLDDGSGAHYVNADVSYAWTAWQARAALAQPSPALPPFAEKVLAKLRRFYDCAEDFESGGVDIGRNWLDLLTQLGLLNRVQRGPAFWEISQQGEDLLGMPQPSPAQAEQAEAERPEVAEVAFVLRNIGAMDAEDIDGDNVDLRFEDAEGRDTGCDVSIVEYAEKAADLFEQHDRIVGALRAENAKLSEALDRWPLIRDSLKLRLADALARVAELEKLSRAHDPLRIGLSAMLGSFKTATNPEQEGTLRMARQLLDATADARYGDFKNKAIVDRLIAGLRTPVAQAQQLHDLDKQCRDDVARALGLRPNQERGFAWSYLLASIKSCVKASEDSAQAQHSVPDGAADLCRFLAKLYCELDGLRYSTAKLPAEQIADALIFKWPVLQGTRNQLNIKRISEQPYDESKLHSAIAAMLAAAPSEKRSCEYAGCCSTAHPGTSLCIAHHSKKVQEQLLAAAPGKEGV